MAVNCRLDKIAAIIIPVKCQELIDRRCMPNVRSKYTTYNMAEGASSIALVGSTGLVVIILEFVLLYLANHIIT